MGDIQKSREFDLIVFGATAYTGQYVVEEVARTAQKEDIKWAISGRNEEKLKNVLTVATQETGNDVNDIPIIIADIDNEESLRAMTARATVVLNIVGPYTLFGEAVVKTCVETGTHYLDISGENNFNEDMHIKYDKKAKQNGVYIISSAGLSTDVWLPYVRRQFIGHVNSVETYNTTAFQNTMFNMGLCRSTIHMMSKSGQMKDIRRRLYLSGGMAT